MHATNRNGETIHTDLPRDGVLKACALSNSNFIRDLLNKLTKYRRLSDAQWYYLIKEANSITTRGKGNPGGGNLKPWQTKLEEGSHKRLTEVFARPTSLKRPKLRFEHDGLSVVLSPAGVGTRNEGMFYVKVNGDYAGKLGKDDVFNRSPEFTRSSANGKVSEVISEVAKDPVNFAIKFGKLSGNCCFCTHELDNAESLHWGYGPVCAKRWGLPHNYAHAKKRENPEVIEEIESPEPASKTTRRVRRSMV